MNIIGTINFFFRKFLKEADKKHQSIMQIEKAAKVFAVQKSSAKLLTSKSLSKRLWIVFKKSLSTKLSTVLLITFFFLFHIFMLSATNKNSVVGAPRRKKVCYREYIHSPLGDGDMFSAYKGELIDCFSSLNLCFNSTNNL